MSSLDWSNKLSLLFDGLLVVTAFIGWYYIDKQLKMTELSNQVATHAMEESRNANDLTRQALEITNRAWITVRDVKLIGTIDRDPLVISYEFENTGHIPAERIEIKVTRTFQKQLGITTADQNPTIGSLAPGQKFTYFHKLPKLSPVAIEAMTNGEIQMSLSGTVAYSDHFAAREHHFCFYWDRDISHFGSCSERDTQQTQRAE